jgi:ribosomal protein S6--L-glutamate ligase
LTEAPAAARQPGPRIGVIGLDDGWSSIALSRALEAETGFGRIIELEHVVADLTRGRVHTTGAEEVDLCTLDGLIVKKIGARYAPEMLDRLELLRFVESRGVRVFSPPERILRMVNRVACTTTLAAHGLPMPPTVMTEDLDHAIETIKTFGEAVVKPIYSTKARGFRLLGPGQDLESELRAHRDESGHPLFYIQKKLDLGGRDLGVIFLDGKYVGTYARVAGSDAWETTIHSGGRYEAYEPEQSIVELARRAAEPFGLTLAGVDVALLDEGPVLFEVSAFGGFRGLREGLGLDGAELLARHVANVIRSGR